MIQTGIGFAHSSWNPIRGCKWKSDGCTNCWAEKLAGQFSIKQEKHPEKEDGRFGPRPGIMSSIAKLDDKGQARWTGNVQWVSKHYYDPLMWQAKGNRRRITVCSMSDLFYPKITHEWRDAIFGLISLCAEHRFMVQTKYAAEMRQYFSTPGVWKRIEKSARSDYKAFWRETCPSKGTLKGPLGNTWLGVSVENQVTADERIPILQDIPAALHYVDAQPLLGPLTLDKYLGDKLDWVIAGGESGLQARPCNPAWIRQLKQECNDHRVHFFMHQWGTWMPITQEQLKEHGEKQIQEQGAEEGKAIYLWPGGEMSVNLNRSDMAGVKKKMAEYGALLDGEDWKQIPFEEEGGNHTSK